MRPSLQRIRRALPDDDPTGYRGEFREFLSAVAEARSPVTPPEDGRRDLEIVLFGYESLLTGKVTPVPLLEKTEASRIIRDDDA
jgi:predicted dehydrogenase